jgi:hypothetical protein
MGRGCDNLNCTVSGYRTGGRAGCVKYGQNYRITTTIVPCHESVNVIFEPVRHYDQPVAIVLLVTVALTSAQQISPYRPQWVPRAWR